MTGKDHGEERSAVGERSELRDPPRRAIGLVRGCATSGSVDEEIGHGDGLVAVRARTTRTEPTSEGVAVRAALLAEEASVARRADVDGGRTRRAIGEWRQRGGMATAPGSLPAGIGAEATPSDRHERSSAAGAGYRYVIVTRRSCWPVHLAPSWS